MKNSLTAFKKFRDKMYHFFSSRKDAAFELVDAISSNTTAKSVVELSLNPLHRRNYASITRVLDEFYPINCEQTIKNDALTKLLSEQCIPETEQHFHVFALDCTPNPRRYSPTQDDRGFVYAINTLSGNKPVTIGHQYSVLAYLPEKTADNNPPWLIPLACQRVATDEKGPLLGMQQISRCLQAQENFSKKCCVLVTDTAYSTPECVVESSSNPNLVQLSRIRGNRVFYHPNIADEDPTRGRVKRFGAPFKLKDESTWHEPDEVIEFSTQTKKGKKQLVKIKSWDNLIMRGKHKANTANCSFRLVQICVYNDKGELFFKKPLWLIVLGEKQLELSLQTIFQFYRQRFDIEHFFRFGKNKLLMNKTQTPELQHEEAWWQLTMIAYAQLYLARELAQIIPKPWEKYLPAFKSDKIATPTQVQRDFTRIIQLIGTPAQPPKPRNNGLGRQLGQKQTPRVRPPIVQKAHVASVST